MGRFRSKSEHPKSVHRLFTGPLHPMELRDGKPTKVTTEPSCCVTCGRFLEAGEGWLLIVPQFKRPPEFFGMCRSEHITKQ